MKVLATKFQSRGLAKIAVEVQAGGHFDKVIVMIDQMIALLRKEDQEDIYFMTGESREALINSPHLEAFKAKDYEVILFFESIDEIIMGHLTEFDDKKFRSVGKGEVKLGSEDEQKAAEDELKAAEEIKIIYGIFSRTIKKRRANMSSW